MKKFWKNILLFVFMVSLLLMVGQARAHTVISFDLDEGNVGGLSGYTGPYAGVNVYLTSETTATITFTAYSNYRFTDGKIVDLNVSATSFDASLPTGFSYNETNTPVDGFGYFNLKYNGPVNYGNSLDIVTIYLTNNSGTWSGAEYVLATNANGNRAAAHLGFFTGSFTDPGNKFITTGYASETPSQVPNVPIPPTVYLLGAGLVGLFGLRRKFKK